MKWLRRFFRWLFRLPAPLTEPDLARLNYIARGAFKVSLQELDRYRDDIDLFCRLEDMQKEGQWAIIVKFTPARGEQWWVRQLMRVFGPPLSRLELSDGRACFCTWRAGG